MNLRKLGNVITESGKLMILISEMDRKKLLMQLDTLIIKMIKLFKSLKKIKIIKVIFKNNNFKLMIIKSFNNNLMNYR